MGMILRTSSFLLVATICNAQHGCEKKIDAINKAALELEVQYQEIKTKADALVAGGCCGGGAECVCLPTPIIDGSDPRPATASGSYCLTVDLPTTGIEVGDGVVIDLNGHTAQYIFGQIGARFTVKNGTVFTQIAVSGNGTVFAYGVKVPEVLGGIQMLVDCSGLTSIKEAINTMLVRCSGGDNPLAITTNSRNVTFFDSYFSQEVSGDESVESMKIYRSTLKDGLSLLNTTTHLELLLYESLLGDVSLIGAYTQPVRMLIESCRLGDCEFGQVGGVTNFSSGLITRSLLGQALFKRCVGVTLNACEIVGELAFDQCENIECDNDFVQTVDDNALIIDGGRSIVLRDCFATVQSTGFFDAGYSFNGVTESLVVLNCYAKGCPVGFLINNPTDGFIGVIKECVADGCSQASYKQSNGQVSLLSYGNVAISKSAVPVANYGSSALASFNPLVTSLTAIETDTVTSWRNISFELP
jgi:hypothetical protein